MAQSIRNLSVGSKVIDAKGNKFIIIAYNHYALNEVTLLSETTPCKMHMSPNNTNIKYPLTEVNYYLQNQYLDSLDKNLADVISVTKLPYTDSFSTYQYADYFLNTKAFILSCKELGIEMTGFHTFPNEKTISYVKNNYGSLFIRRTWTRTEENVDDANYYFAVANGFADQLLQTSVFEVRPVINLPADILVSDGVSNGYYSFIFNEPPVIQNISNIKGNYGSATDIVYTATDNDDTNLAHYISFDNGENWKQITPKRVGNIYTYSHVFDELKTYYCRIKVVDSAENITVSNGFIVEVNATSPTVNIVSVVDRVITFKVNCLTHNISKVEILVNNNVVKSFNNGFDFNLVYELDRVSLNTGKNSIQIKAISSGGLHGYKDLEANKTTYNLPPVGTKVVISNNVYTIINAQQSGANQVYTLDRNLKTNVSKGQEIKIEQDSVKVLCSLANLESRKDFKEMKLVKSKKLKGMFEGYVEEKYELEGEGRYSAIKLETERFNNSVESEIIELQQYFDYMED